MNERKVCGKINRAMGVACLLPVVATAICVAGCARRSEPQPGGNPLMMGTSLEVLVAERGAARHSEYDSAARAVIRRLETLVSIYSSTSEIATLNRQAGRSPVRISSDTSMMLHLSRKYWRLSRGAFDVTVGPLVQLWGFSGGIIPAVPPDQNAIEQRLALIGCQNILLKNNMAYLNRDGMKVDLGGIAKGYAVDMAWSELRNLQARDFMINLGGNMRCDGRPDTNRCWRVGVRNPFERSATLGAIELGDGMSVATSGNYERFAAIGGAKYAHIIDPRSGKPVYGMAGVTVVSRSACAADAMSTAFFVLGVEEGIKILPECPPGTEVLFVPDRQPIEIIMTSGMAKIFSVEPGIAMRIL